MFDTENVTKGGQPVLIKTKYRQGMGMDKGTAQLISRRIQAAGHPGILLCMVLR